QAGGSGRVPFDSCRENSVNRFASGVITLLVAELQRPSLRLVILRCLAVVTSHGGPTERRSVANKAGKAIVNLAAETDSNEPVFAWCITVLSHSSLADLFSASASHSVKKKGKGLDIDAAKLLDVMVRASKHRDEHIAGHAFHTVAILTETKAELVLKSQDAIQTLVGHLRSPDVIDRVNALRGFFLLFANNPPEPVTLDPQRLVHSASLAFKQNMHYKNEMEARGIETGVLFSILMSLRQSQSAFMKNVKDRDMLSLGKELYRLLMMSEWGIADGKWGDEHGRDVDIGLPYTSWFEALPHCIKALRNVNPQSEEATVLEIKYNIKHRRFSTAHEIAKNWIDTVNVKNTYCYYALSIQPENDSDGLMYAKKVTTAPLSFQYGSAHIIAKWQGLRTNPGGYLLHGLLHNAMDIALYLAMDVLGDPSKTNWDSKKQLEYGMALFQSMFADSQKYLDLAPPDDRLYRAVVAKHMCLFVAIKGPTHVSPDLKELKPFVSRLAVVDSISTDIWGPVVQTTARATWDIIKAKYTTAAAQFDPIFKQRANHGVHTHNDEHEQAVTPDGLESLVEDLCQKLDQPLLDTDEANWRTHLLSPRYDESSLILYTCSECGNPSAQTKKCGRCGGARYCDEKCQKAAWKQHRTVCKAGPLVVAQPRKEEGKD
ncbi:hypothetical protein FRC02_001041, partial [Tulasnella sp. 418]